MESQMIDDVQLEKEMAIARFNRANAIVKLRQILEVSLLFGLVSWAAMKLASEYVVEFSNYLLNYHVVFLIGNAIIVLLFTLCRGNDVVGGRDIFDDYLRCGDAASHRRDCAEDAVAECGDDVVREKAVSQCDELEAVVEKATRQIERFQRTQSEILKREITARRRAPELRRSETNGRKADASDAAEIETLSSEEFRRRVDAFIDKHWSKRTTPYQLEENVHFSLLNHSSILS